jgi:RNA polymerase sigma factor (TIGR02999 family)
MNHGEDKPVGDSFRLAYDELRRLATRCMAKDFAGHTLQPTALVHEAWLRLGAEASPVWQNRAHFFAAAAEAMRRILVDRARRKQAQRRGAGAVHVELDEVEIAAPAEDEELLALDDALNEFAREHPQKAELVKLRFFVGLTLDQAAGSLNISTATADRWWAYSRAWLFRKIGKR